MTRLYPDDCDAACSSKAIWLFSYTATVPTSEGRHIRSMQACDLHFDAIKNTCLAAAWRGEITVEQRF